MKTGPHELDSKSNCFFVLLKGALFVTTQFLFCHSLLGPLLSDLGFTLACTKRKPESVYVGMPLLDMSTREAITSKERPEDSPPCHNRRMSRQI